MEFNYRLEIWGDSVILQVLELPEELTGNKLLFEVGDFKVGAYHYTELNRHYIALNKHPASRNIGTLTFRTEEESRIYYEKVIETLEAFKESLEIVGKNT